MRAAPTSDHILRVYQQVHTLLHEEMQPSVQAQAELARLERQLDIRIPVAIHMWFSLTAAPACMRKIAVSHSPITLDELEAAYTRFNRTYARTAPSPCMLPVLFENQGVWHMAVPVDGQVDPPVYMGYQEDTQFEWHVHTEHFSDFIYAWTWDYLPYASGLTWRATNITVHEMDRISSMCEQGPTSYRTNGFFNSERFERYASGSYRLTILLHQTQPYLFATEETRLFLEALLQRPNAIQHR